jgi:hypothetical protein
VTNTRTDNAAVFARVLLLAVIINAESSAESERCLMERDTKAVKIVNQTTALASESDNPWSEIGTEHGTQTLLKYVKGVWFITDDEVPLGTKYVAFINELALLLH